MNILINCSNLKKGGGIQVGDSICCSLYQFPEHKFTVVLPYSYMNETYERLKDYSFLTIVRYDLPKNIRTILTGRDKYLDKLVEDNEIQGVLTIFGPSLWSPKCKHLCGFARAQLLIPKSPYFLRMSRIELIKNKLSNLVMKHIFDKSSDIFYTENPYISNLLRKLYPNKKVYTVTNYYNQVFDNPDQWDYFNLQKFDGVTLLSVNAPYPHKNLGIAVDVAKKLREKHPNFKFRFVMTVQERDLPLIPQELKNNFIFIGKIDVSSCPSLYKQADICFQPTLLECFSATYAEAMRMGVPIITTDIEFAKGLCEDAAEYYSALSPESASEAIYKVAIDIQYRNKLISRGLLHLSKYDSYNERASKLISILVKDNNNN